MTAPRVAVGNSDLEVFPINLGGNTFGWTTDEAESFAVLDAYVAAGGNFIDTADMYSVWAPGNPGGESERVIAKWLAARGNREEIVLATKVGKMPGLDGLAPETVRRAVADSLERLGTDHVDILYAHRDDEDQPIEVIAELFDALVTAGFTRYIGASNFSAQRLQEWFALAAERNLAAPVAIQPEYHLLNRKEVENSLLPLARANGASLFTYFALASGLLTGKYRSAADIEERDRTRYLTRWASDDAFKVVDVLVDIAERRGVEPATIALAWQREKGVTAPIASARTPRHLDSLIASVNLALSEDEVAELDQVSAPFA